MRRTVVLLAVVAAAVRACSSHLLECALARRVLALAWASFGLTSSRRVPLPIKSFSECYHVCRRVARARAGRAGLGVRQRLGGRAVTSTTAVSIGAASIPALPSPRPTPTHPAPWDSGGATPGPCPCVSGGVPADHRHGPRRLLIPHAHRVRLLRRRLPPRKVLHALGVARGGNP